MRVHARNVEARCKGNKLYTVQHDLAKAYNRMSPRLALAMLKELGAPCRVLKVLEYQYQHLEIHNRLGSGVIGPAYRLGRGLPQGDPIA
eukprot:2448471-Amphidinium_carterae.1